MAEAVLPSRFLPPDWLVPVVSTPRRARGFLLGKYKGQGKMKPDVEISKPTVRDIRVNVTYGRVSSLVVERFPYLAVTPDINMSL